MSPLWSRIVFLNEHIGRWRRQAAGMRISSRKMHKAGTLSLSPELQTRPAEGGNALYSRRSIPKRECNEDEDIHPRQRGAIHFRRRFCHVRALHDRNRWSHQDAELQRRGFRVRRHVRNEQSSAPVFGNQDAIAQRSSPVSLPTVDGASFLRSLRCGLSSWAVRRSLLLRSSSQGYVS